MERTNLIGKYKSPLSQNASSTTFIYSCNVGDCGNFVINNNKIQSFYDMNFTALLNNQYIYYSTSTIGFQNRLLTLGQATPGLIWKDTQAIVGNATAQKYGELKVYKTSLTVGQPVYGFFGLFAISYCINGTITGQALTDWNNSYELKLWGLSTVGLTFPAPYTTFQNLTQTTGYTSSFTANNTEGWLVLNSAGTFGRMYKLSIDMVICAFYGDDSYFTLRVYNGINTLIGTQIYYLKSTMRNYNIIYQQTFKTLDDGTDVNNQLRATIQYTGNGVALNPYIFTSSTYYCNILLEEL
jgi:hypothetical protein